MIFRVEKSLSKTNIYTDKDEWNLICGNKRTETKDKMSCLNTGVER